MAPLPLWEILDAPLTMRLSLFTDVWRGYVGYDVDVVRPSFIVKKNALYEESEHHKLLDGDVDSCIQMLNNRTCDEQLKVFSSVTFLGSRVRMINCTCKRSSCVLKICNGKNPGSITADLFALILCIVKAIGLGYATVSLYVTWFTPTRPHQFATTNRCCWVVTSNASLKNFR